MSTTLNKWNYYLEFCTIFMIVRKVTFYSYLLRAMSAYEVVIIGGGPAGLTAGMYACRAGLKTLLLERGLFGGQMVNASRIENYPGFPDGISGFELATLMHQQATKYGLETANLEVVGIKQASNYIVNTNAGDFETRSIIIAAGSEYRRLKVPGENKLLGRGVSYCATCDGFLFRDLDVAVVGGGDTALTDAIELSEHVSSVFVIHRRDQLRATETLQKQAFSKKGLNFIWNTVVEEIIGEEKVDGLKLRNVKTGKSSTLKVSGVFIAIGLEPRSQSFANLVNLDETGHIIVNELMSTRTPGIFAAGDIRTNSPRQISSAVGDGAIAALSAFRYLRGGR